MIILYGGRGCGRCFFLKKKLEEKGIVFEYCDDIATLRKSKIMSVPQLKVGDTMYGFDEAIDYIGGLGT